MARRQTIRLSLLAWSMAACAAPVMAQGPTPAVAPISLAEGVRQALEKAYLLQLAREDVNAQQATVRQAQAAEAATRTGPSQVRSAQARLAAAAARVAKEQATVKEAELRLEYTVVKAPSNGIVSRKSVEPGQILQPGQPLLALVGQDDVWVVANFKETQLARIQVGQRAVIDIDAYSHREFEGKVLSISGGTGASFALLPADNASGNFVKVVQRVPVRIAWSAAPDVPLRAGLSVDVTVHTGD